MTAHVIAVLTAAVEDDPDAARLIFSTLDRTQLVALVFEISQRFDWGTGGGPTRRIRCVG
jgi:hypothetical protein